MTQAGRRPRKVECDLEYLEEQSFWNDLRIMLETIPVILLRKGW